MNFEHERKEVRKTVDALGMPVDPKIQNAVALFNYAGFPTVSSCAGHIERGSTTPYIGVSSSDKRENKTLGSRLRQAAGAFNSRHSLSGKLKVRVERIEGFEGDEWGVTTLPVSGGMVYVPEGPYQEQRTAPSLEMLQKGRKVINSFANYLVKQYGR